MENEQEQAPEIKISIAREYDNVIAYPGLMFLVGHYKNGNVKIRVVKTVRENISEEKANGIVKEICSEITLQLPS